MLQHVLMAKHHEIKVTKKIAECGTTSDSFLLEPVLFRNFGYGLEKTAMTPHAAIFLPSQ